ncbi:MAG: hypothetical protein QME32_08445, partial [Endomicrobiia bacterium]|nr:hypothetical protein [Endomicrobiia bacterium]
MKTIQREIAAAIGPLSSPEQIEKKSEAPVVGWEEKPADVPYGAWEGRLTIHARVSGREQW